MGASIRNRCALIVTALPEEYQAVRAHLKDLREERHRGTVYEVGKFPVPKQEPWSVVIVEVGPGQPAAATETERAIAHFRPKIAMFVGVAGGIKDVSLCDVVAATKVYGYESGKEQGTFQARPEDFRPSHALLQRARAEAKKDAWASHLQAKFKLPKPPKVFIKPIASGEKIIADKKSSLLGFLRQNYGDAVAVEMEGWGFLHAIQSNASVCGMVIRGVSDLIDRKSVSDRKGYQTRASQTASSFAFQILATLDSKARRPTIHISDARSNLLVPRRSPVAAKTRPWQIALISPGIESPGFHAEVLEYLVLNFGRIPDMDFQLIPFLPKKPFDTLELWGMLDKIKNRQAHADAVILIPDYPDQRFASIQQFMRVRSDTPLILFDVLFDISRVRKLDPQILPVSIGGDETEGGAIAANIALNHLAEWKLNYPPNCLILAGADTMWESGRTRGFKETFKSRHPDVCFTESKPLQYSRLATFEYCMDKFEELKSKDVPFDVIFACNDTMAFGVRSAMIQGERRGFTFKPHLRIVGYDGAKEMKWFLRDSDPYFLGTVDVNINFQTSLCVEAVKSALIRDAHSSTMTENDKRANIKYLANGKVRLVRPSALVPSRNR